VNQSSDGFKASRKEALIAGDKFFFTGLLCKRNHLSARRTDNSSCVQCLNDRSRTYYNENIEDEKSKSRSRKSRRYAENPEPFKEAERKRRAKNPERFKKQAQNYYDKNREERKAVVTVYREANREYISERKKQKYQSLTDIEKLARTEIRRAKWDDNPELRDKSYKKAKEYRINNPDKVRAGRVNYLARLRNAPGDITKDDILALHDKQNGLCFYCIEPYTDYHADHYIPLSKGGTNYPSNIVIACPTCNLRKKDRMPDVFLALIRA
jgi:5-methylcytosine-specific restriction endonuclease McrA